MIYTILDVFLMHTERYIEEAKNGELVYIALENGEELILRGKDL